MRLAVAHPKNSWFLDLWEKCQSQKISKRCLLAAKKVLYKSQLTLHPYHWPFMPSVDNLCFSPKTANYSNGHSSDFSSDFFLFWVTWIDTFMPIYGSELQISFTLKSCELFDMSKKSQNWHLMAQQTTNPWHIQKSKLGYVKYRILHLRTDSWSNESMLSAL